MIPIKLVQQQVRPALVRTLQRPRHHGTGVAWQAAHLYPLGLSQWPHRRGTLRTAINRSPTVVQHRQWCLLPTPLLHMHHLT